MLNSCVLLIQMFDGGLIGGGLVTVTSEDDVLVFESGSGFGFLIENFFKIFKLLLELSMLMVQSITFGLHCRVFSLQIDILSQISIINLINMWSIGVGYWSNVGRHMSVGLCNF